MTLADLPKPIKMFYCYAPEDRRLFKQFKKQLAPLERLKTIGGWAIYEIRAGRDRAREIEMHLNTANIILLLVSPDFLASDLCYSIAIEQVLARHLKRETLVIPVLLRPALWQVTLLGNLQALPRNNKPITTWRDRDAAFLDVVIELWRLIKELMKEDYENHIPPGSRALERHDTVINKEAHKDMWNFTDNELEEVYAAYFRLIESARIVLYNKVQKMFAEKRWYSILEPYFVSLDAKYTYMERYVLFWDWNLKLDNGSIFGDWSFLVSR